VRTAAWILVPQVRVHGEGSGRAEKDREGRRKRGDGAIAPIGASVRNQ
jgi:hypothetical protein